MEIVFESPAMLLLFILVPVLIALHYYFFEHNKKKAMKFANFSAMKRVTGTHLITKNTGQLAIRVITLSLMILAAAKPVLWTNGEVSSSDYVIAIDSSASMLSTDVAPDRITVAKQSAKSFIDSIGVSASIGVVSFTGTTFIKELPTTDTGAVKGSIERIEIELAGGTDIGAALITATNILLPSNASKVIILITDGSDTSGILVDESVETSLEYLKENHVIVHAIGIGTGNARPGYVETEGLKAAYERGTLKMIADATNGKFFEVGTTAEMSAAFKEIKSTSTKGMISRDFKEILVSLAIILILIEWVLVNTRFRPIP
ncbi:MAG: VWA domain-containing protein [Nanoarchaeota archaeon]|nr:VWA domain-containing protein [Nanoarchaeota archaeon]